MTDWENRIISIFLERYPSSAARPLRIGMNRLFPGFETASPDSRESFLEAAESLEKRGLVAIRWVRRRKGEALSALACADPEALFVFAGRPSPAILAETAREAAREIARTARNDGVQSLFAFMAENIGAEDALRGIDADSVRDLARLTENGHLPGSIREGSEPRGGITPRALSVALYGNSKRLEEVCGLFGRLLNRAEHRGIGIPDLSGLGRSFPDTLIAGKLRIRFEPEADAADTGPSALPPLVNAAGYILGLPLVTVLKIREITPLPCGGSLPDSDKNNRVLTVENKETFYTLAADPQFLRDFSCLLYTGGHPNGAVRALVSALAGSGFDFFHAGDLDPDGILILQELAEIAGKPVNPVLMNGPVFDRYAHCGRRLEPSMLSRLRLIGKSTRGLPGIEDLIKKIAEGGIGIEQEIIDYRACNFSF
ncbi:MAG: DUF2220 family protein [Treponema sp.]|jgi:hypothetical protein|nr:DUF2220 family protein [Treponema sp.]